MKQDDTRVTDSYEDIINLPHPEPRIHARMPRENRAAQFAPFAALSGYEDAVNETARLTDERIELNEYARDALNDAMRRIQCSLQKGEHPSLEVTYFVPDERKAGGRYETVSGMIRKLDVGIGYLFLMDGQKIRIQDISSADWIKTEKTTDQPAMP